MARPEILAAWLQFTEKHALLLSIRRNPSQPSGPDFTSQKKALIAHVLIGKPVPTFPGHALGCRKTRNAAVHARQTHRAADRGGRPVPGEHGIDRDRHP